MVKDTSTGLSTTISSPKIWYATMILRWKRTLTDDNVDMTLQQLWQCSDGTQEWRAVETVD